MSPPVGINCTALPIGASGAPAPPAGYTGSWYYVNCSGPGFALFKTNGTPLASAYVPVGTADWLPLPGAVYSGGTPNGDPVTLKFTDSSGVVQGSTVTVHTVADLPVVTPTASGTAAVTWGSQLAAAFPSGLLGFGALLMIVVLIAEWTKYAMVSRDD